MSGTADHIVKSFDDELQRLKQTLSRMGGVAEAQLASAIQAVMRRDADGAARVIEADDKVDTLEHEVDAFSIRLLALRQPMAADLREVVAALRISADIERIGDYAANIAKRAIALAQTSPVQLVNGIARMGRLTQAMIKNVLDAYVARDVAKATAVWRGDSEVDDMYNSLFRELLTYMMEDPRNITACTHLLFIAKNIERIGDHATNIAESIVFLVEGRRLSEPRPKHDEANFAVVEGGPRAGSA